MKEILKLRGFYMGLAVLLLLAGCEQGRDVEKGDRPKIILKGNHVIYSGTPLELGGELSDWLEVLGPYERKAMGDMLWDSLGIEVVRSYSKVKIFRVILNHRFPPKYRDPGPAPGEEGGAVKQIFSGYLEIGGVSIDSETTVEDINKKIDSPYGFSCSRGMNICSALVGEKKQLIAVNVDGRKEKSPIYSIAFTAKPLNKKSE